MKALKRAETRDRRSSDSDGSSGELLELPLSVLPLSVLLLLPGGLDASSRAGGGRATSEEGEEDGEDEGSSDRPVGGREDKKRIWGPN